MMKFLDWGGTSYVSVPDLVNWLMEYEAKLEDLIDGVIKPSEVPVKVVSGLLEQELRRTVDA